GSASTAHTKTSHDPNSSGRDVGQRNRAKPCWLTPCTFVNAPPAWAPPPPAATAETPIGLPTTSGSQPFVTPSASDSAISLRRVLGLLHWSGSPWPSPPMQKLLKWPPTMMPEPEIATAWTSPSVTAIHLRAPFAAEYSATWPPLPPPP